MARIEQEWLGVKFVMYEDGSIYANGRRVLYESIQGWVTSAGNGFSLQVIERALQMHKEWLDAVEREKAEREPETKLPKGYRYEKIHGEWSIVNIGRYDPGDACWTIPYGNSSWELPILEAAIEAAKELASRTAPEAKVEPADLSCCCACHTKSEPEPVNVGLRRE